MSTPAEILTQTAANAVRSTAGDVPIPYFFPKDEGDIIKYQRIK